MEKGKGSTVKQKYSRHCQSVSNQHCSALCLSSDSSLENAMGFFLMQKIISILREVNYISTEVVFRVSGIMDYMSLNLGRKEKKMME